MLGRLQKESMSDPKNPFFLSFFFLHLVTTEREIVSSESPCFRFNPLASLKLRLVSFHDAWSPVQFLTRASRFLTPFPFTSPSIFSRAAYLAFLSVVETVHSLSRVDHRPLDFRNRSTWPGFLGRFADRIISFVLWIDKRFLFQAANRSRVLLRSRLFALTRRTRVANDAPEILVHEARYLESQISNNLILYRAAKIPKSLDTKKLRNLPSLRSVVFHPTIIAAYYLERFAHLSSQFLSRRGGISAKKGNGLNSWWTY